MKLIKLTIKGLIILLAIYGIFVLIGRAIDKGIDNQNTMLCDSAKISGNRAYRIKCTEYYETGEIKYMRELTVIGL